MITEIQIELAETKAEFRHIIKTAVATTNATANTPTDRRGDIADVLMLRNILTTVSINQLLEPTSVAGIPALSFPDPLSIGVLTRSVAETYLTLFGLACLKCSLDENKFRLDWWSWHELNERIRARDIIKSKKPGVEKWDEDKKLLEQTISNHPLFCTLPDDLKGDFKNGNRPRRATFETIRKLAGIAGIHPERFEVLYQITSAAAHAEPTGLGLLRQHKPNDEEVIRAVKLQVSFATAFLSFSIRDFVTLFPKGQAELDEDFAKILNVWSYVFAQPF